MKLRLFEIVNEIEKVNIDIIKSWLESLKCDYLAVLHNLDDTRPHYHIYVRMITAREIEDIAKQCGISSNYIQKVKSWNSALAYAFHLNAPTKHKYDKSAVVFSNVDLPAIFETYENIVKTKQRQNEIDMLINDYGQCKISQKILIDNLSNSEYCDNIKRIKASCEYRQLQIKERNMEVIYICGIGGTGKTTLAKYMAQQQNYDYFISGSGKDVLDGYDKQECIILDDLRADAFTKAELFKFLDNNTNSSVKSRYHNKDISYCKLMIITSVRQPHELYDWKSEEYLEGFVQFARRIKYKFYYVYTNGIIECIHYDKVNPLLSNLTSSKLKIGMPYIFKQLGIRNYTDDLKVFRHLPSDDFEFNRLIGINNKQFKINKYTNWSGFKYKIKKA